MLDSILGNYALRSNIPGSDPEVAKVVSTAANLVADLQALSLTQKQISRVSSQAVSDVELVSDDPGLFLSKSCDNMKELVCSYLFTYDEEISAFSEIPAVSQYLLDNPTYEKEPEQILSILNTPLLVPAIPGNIFYTACGNNIQLHNPALYSQYIQQKTLYPAKTDTEIIVALLPKFMFPGSYTGGNQIDPDLSSRWQDLLLLTNDVNIEDKTDTFMLDGDLITVTRQSDEVIAIAGLRTKQNYKAFMALRNLDNLLDSISFLNARTLVLLYQEAGASPYHVDIWLAKLKLLLAGKNNLTSLLMNYFTNRQTLEEYQDIWSWFGQVPVTSESTPADLTDILESNAELKNIKNLSMSYIAPLGATGDYYYLLDVFGTSTEHTDVQRSAAFSGVFVNWYNQLRSRGGILGVEAVILAACLTALERIKVGASVNQSDSFISWYASDGLRLSGYLSNPGPIKNAFKSLVDSNA